MDDLAIVVANIFDTIPRVMELFALFASFAGLELKLSKCVAAPLVQGDTSELVSMVRLRLPVLENFIFAGATEYLRFRIILTKLSGGNNCHDTCWVLMNAKW